MSKERIVIVAYRPLPGKKESLKELMRTHAEILRNEGLVTKRKPILMQATDGTFIEVFGWKSKEAIEEAHSNPVVQKMWEDYAQVCEYIPVGEVLESKNLFSEFSPVDFS